MNSACGAAAGIDESLKRAAIVARGRLRAGAAVRIGRARRRKRCAVGAAGIQRACQREAEGRALGWRGVGAPQRCLQSQDQRILGRGELAQLRIARQCLVGARVALKNALVGGCRLRAFAAIAVQVGKIHQGGEVLGRQMQRLAQLLLGLLVTAQEIGEDHRAIEMHFFGPADAVRERLSVGGERGLELACAPLQQSQVVPGVRELRPTRQQALVEVDGGRQLAGGREAFGLPDQALRRISERHRSRVRRVPQLDVRAALHRAPGDEGLVLCQQRPHRVLLAGAGHHEHRLAHGGQKLRRHADG